MKRIDPTDPPAKQREYILEVLEAGLAPIPAIHALWLEGSLATGTADNLSDVDIWLDVDDAQLDEALEWVADILRPLGQLDLDHPQPHQHPLICQRIFHLVGTPETLTIEVCAQAHSRDFVFVHETVYERPLVRFDKTGTIRFAHADRAIVASERRKRVEELCAQYALYHRWAAKPIRRGHFLEALAYYHGRLLVVLVELLRLRHTPTKSEFHLKHADRDLPSDIARQLGELYRVTSIADIVARLPDVDKLFTESVRARTAHPNEEIPDY